MIRDKKEVLFWRTNVSILKEAGTKSLATCLTVPACQIGGDWCQWSRSIVRTHLPKGNNCHRHLPHWWKALALLLPSGGPLETGCTKDWPLCPPLSCPPWKSYTWHDESSTCFLISKLESRGPCVGSAQFCGGKKRKKKEKKEITV